ncbi:MAG: hypothetical protein JNL70_19635 [Saprospiraceae bacterium]|nr:hypothetical protein [Saprospiraceae bacterium]
MSQTNILKVGILPHAEKTPFADFIHQTLSEGNIDAEFQYFSYAKDAVKAVLEGDIAAYACPFHFTPIELPMGLVIAALSKRKSAQTCLVHSLAEQRVDKKVFTHSDIDCSIMQYLQPNYDVKKNDQPISNMICLQSAQCDAVVMSSSDTEILSLGAEWVIQPFSVREFTPAAGQGVACFITNEEDLTTRRLLKTIHHPSVSAVTNIERTVQKMLLSHSVNAYCERDTMGNYHLWAAAVINGELRKTRVSQSTTFGMAEKAVEQLLSA